MKTIIMSVIALVVLSGITAQADELAGYQKRMRAWENDRDEIVLRIVLGWLRGADGEALKEEMVRLTQLEVRLASDPDVELYLSRLSDARDIDLCVRDVARKYLQKRGLIVRTEDLFAGQKFEMERCDDLPEDNNKKCVAKKDGKEPCEPRHE